MFSTTYVAGIISVIAFVLPMLGFEIADEGTLTNWITGVIGAIGAVYVFYGRYKAGGISVFGIKKKKEVIE